MRQLRNAIRYLFYYGVVVLFSDERLLSQIQVGANVGTNWGIFAVENQIQNATNETKFGYAFGGIIEIPLNKRFSIVVSPSYIQKGSKIAFPIAGRQNIQFNNHRIDYLQLPVSLKTRFVEKTIIPFAFAGPNIGYLLSAGVNWNSLGYSRYDDVTIEYNRIDFALDAGIGVEYEVYPALRYFLQFQYSFGLANIYKLPTGTIKNHGSQLYFGVLWSL